MSRPAFIAACAVAAALAGAWLLRWEKLHGTAAGVFLLDRWTGQVQFVSPSGRRTVEPRPAPPPAAADFLDAR